MERWWRWCAVVSFLFQLEAFSSHLFFCLLLLLRIMHTFNPFPLAQVFSPAPP